MSDIKQRIDDLRRAYQALPTTWPTNPVRLRSRVMLAQIVALLSERASEKRR